MDYDDFNPRGVSESEALKIICVLRSGGDFDADYVHNLYRGISHNTSIRHQFICLTDVPDQVNCFSIPLFGKAPGWWAKIELFRFIGPVVYFDLDTVILSRLDSFFSTILQERGRIFMLRSFNPEKKYGEFASGVMGWNGDFRFIYDRFRHMHMVQYRMDQRYICRALSSAGISPLPIQDYLPGVYSFKRHCQDGIPKDASVVCFHGKPRLKDVYPQWSAIK